jgi:folate-binding protein YgfZ
MHPSVIKGLLSSKPIAWLRVQGADATGFLQGQCTQDLRSLRPGQSAFALWLNPKGRILGESWVLKDQADGWWLWSAHTPGNALRTRLEDFIIADDVTVHPEETRWRQTTLAGPAAAEWLRELLNGAQPPEPGQWTPIGAGLLFAGRRGLEQTWEWLCPEDAVATSPRPPQSLGPLTEDDLRKARIAAGTPAIPEEFGPNDLPQEAGLESVAISFNKGCYLGQEVMARLHAMGQVRRHLVRISGEGAAPAAGIELLQNGKRAGEIRAIATSAEGSWLGLAIVNLLGLDPSGGLTTADGAAVRLVDAPLP